MLRTSASAIGLVFILAVAPRAQSSGQPSTLAIDSALSLKQVGEATRGHYLGTVDLYSIALYVDGSTPDRVRLAAPDVAKALRIEVKYKDDLRRRVSLDWQQELMPVLEPAAAAHLRGAFAPLWHGDVVLIEYSPNNGTTVRVNKSVAVSGANHDLMLAFLDHWLGQRPLSEEIKRMLLGS